MDGDHAALERSEQARQRQDRVLSRIATGASLAEVLDDIVQLIEGQLPGSIGSVLLLDRAGARVHFAAGQRLPAAFSEAIEGQPIGPSAGSCGTAAYRREPVVVSDIATDPLWADYRQFALAHNLRACWSFPILASTPVAEGQAPAVLGTFALYRHEPAEPEPSWVTVLAGAAHLAGLVIERSRAAQDLRESEAALRRSDETLRRAQDIAHLASWTYDIEHDAFSGSGAVARMLGFPAGQPEPMDALLRVVHPDDLQRMQAAWQAALNGAPYEIEHRVIVHDEIRWLSVVAAPDAFVDDRPVSITGVTQDVTARRRLEEQVQQSQKMEAVGLLAGGIAHDFNNLLTVIAGHSDLILSEMPPDHPLRPDVAAIRNAGERAARLTGQLLAFSRKAIVEPKVLELNRVVGSMGELLDRLLGENITLSTRLQADLSQVRADPGQMEQLLMNLAVNARDAMPDGGRLTVRTWNVLVRDSDVKRYPDREPGHYACLSVTDTGCGMTDEVKGRIFEPFFTTRALGKGTGLGLATVFGIVKQAGGYIDVETAVGRGSEFRVLLPAVTPPLIGAPPAADDRLAVQAVETVLIAEDEEGVRRLTRVVLETQGYTVIEAQSGSEALARAQSHDGPIHVLLTDVVMSDLSGRELADRIRAIRPQIRVLYMSGHSGDALVRQGVSNATDLFLRKPFTPSALISKVRSALSSGAGASSA